MWMFVLTHIKWCLSEKYTIHETKSDYLHEGRNYEKNVQMVEITGAVSSHGHHQIFLFCCLEMTK